MKSIAAFCIVAAVLIAALWLPGCTFIAGVGGVISVGKEVYDDANLVEADTTGLKKLICQDELQKPHSSEFLAAATKYCSEVPTSLLTAVKADYDASQAWEAEKAKQKVTP